ncbi:MAG: holo-ACP synthase [Acidimicrobiales bacterium]|jgi:holo-[acyl-carrier protein] synthase
MAPSGLVVGAEAGPLVAPEEGSPGGGAPLGLGLDLVDIGRFGALLARRPSASRRLFTDGERAYAATLANPVPSLAARFAAKEAVMKAMGVGLGAFAFADVEVERQASGQPTLVLTGGAAHLAARRDIRSWLVSLTHTGTVAAAVVIALS